MKSETEISHTKLVGIIDFHGITVTVVESNAVKYIQAKPLADAAGIDWRSARKVLFNADNPKLYGTSTFFMPKTDDWGRISSPKKAVYVRLDRSEMYLARIDTSRMRGQGKEEAADQLLALQIEWAQVLHDYETQGIAINKGEIDVLNALYKLDKIKDPTLKQIYAARINEAYGLNIPIAHQTSLELN